VPRPPKPSSSNPAAPATRRTALILAGGAAVFLGAIALFSSIGGSHDPVTGLVAVLELLIRAGAPVIAYLAAAAGLGRLFRPLLRGARALELPLGLALLLSTTHLLGTAGAFGRGGPLPTALAWLPIALGLILLTLDLRGTARKPLTLNPWWLVILPPLALILVAACQPPGSLWSSEGYGYDALEYHLQLPQEWLALGRIRPLEHNVYSFLPGYIEDAFLHLAVLTGAAAHPGPFGLQTADRAITAQLFSAALALLAAIGAGNLVTLVTCSDVASAPRPTLSRPTRPLLAALLLSTPWFTVTGSSAYNDVAVLALMAPAVAAAFNTALSPTARGLVTGLLIGVACGCKPTALLLAAPPVGIALLARTAPRDWPKAVIPGVLAGLLALAPWLIRNWLYAGNPLFPAATALLGHAHWTAEQIARYTAAHHFQGSLLDRLRLLILPDTTDPAGPTHRGLLHPQYLALFPAIALAAVVALTRRATHKPAAILCAGLAAQLLAWLFATHLQSRFLLPLAIPGAALIGLLVPLVPPTAALSGRWSRAVLPAIAIGLLAAAQLTASILNFSHQNGGNPNQHLLFGPGLRTGELFRDRLAAAAAIDRERLLRATSPEQYCNLALPQGSRLYLLAEARPFYFTIPTIYSTTWDASPLADAIRKDPANPQAWAAALKSRGTTHILFNAAELARLQRSGKPPSGWADPALTSAAVDRFFTTQCTPVRSWPEAGITLFAWREPISPP
jgi:hypothetical protein